MGSQEVAFFSREDTAMDGSSILLPIDGSIESLWAANFAWRLAKRTDSSVTAQHVIDTDAVWQMLAYDQPGLIGSGIYLEAREKILEALRCAGEALMVSYQARAGALDIESRFFLDEGCPLFEIADRASNHDLIVMGFNNATKRKGRRRCFELLAAVAPVPVMVLRDIAEDWTCLRILVTNSRFTAADMDGIYGLSSKLGLSVEIVVNSGVVSIDNECLNLDGWSKSTGVTKIREANISETLLHANESEIVVLDADMVRENCSLSSPIEDYMNSSSKHAVILWQHSSLVTDRCRKQNCGEDGKNGCRFPHLSKAI